MAVITHTASSVGVISAIEKTIIETICTQLNEILDLYLDGDPARAYYVFERMIQQSGLHKELLKLNIIKPPKRKPFFKAQADHNCETVSADSFRSSIKTTHIDLFHPPFDERKRVGTNRFSIPGYPRLYISVSTTSGSKSAELTSFTTLMQLAGALEVHPSELLKINFE